MTEEASDKEIQDPPPKTKKRSGWFSNIMLWLNWFVVIGLLLSSIAPMVSPAVFWPLSFFGLIQPLFVLLNLIFFIYWLIRRQRHVFYSLAILLISVPHDLRQFRIRFSTPEKAPASAFTLVSYNAKLFDLYNWTGNKETRARIFSMLKSQSPDVLAVQEFFNQDSGTFRNLDSLKRLLNMPYVHVEYTITLRKDDHWGVATFSKFPIVNQGKIVFNNRNNNICIYTDVIIRTDTVRIYNMHLQSVSFGYADYKFLEQLSKGEDADSEIESSKNILRRMKRASVKRANQAEAIAEHISKCHYPVIVCGDFNDTPVSYTYSTIVAGLEDAFLEKGSGLGKSFVNPFPLPRIDYILHSQHFHAWEFETINEEGLSDHFPVKCKMTLK